MDSMLLRRRQRPSLIYLLQNQRLKMLKWKEKRMPRKTAQPRIKMLQGNQKIKK
jgi:hypothetical protein